MVRCNKCNSIGESMLVVFFVNLGLTNGAEGDWLTVGLINVVDTLTNVAVGLKKGAVGLTDVEDGLTDVEEVCDWLTVGAEGLTNVCDGLTVSLTLAEAGDVLTVRPL
ncbi:hypothetical protein Tco_1316062 [Tanacetum coccineum]